MILQATHTHLYPGSRGSISGPGRIAEIGTGQDCLLEFSDGSATSARIERSVNGWQLCASPYRTSAGTEIPHKRWLIGIEENSGRVTFRVLEKARSD